MSYQRRIRVRLRVKCQAALRMKFIEVHNQAPSVVGPQPFVKVEFIVKNPTNRTSRNAKNNGMFSSRTSWRPQERLTSSVHIFGYRYGPRRPFFLPVSLKAFTHNNIDFRSGTQPRGGISK